jgi:membrane protein
MSRFLVHLRQTVWQALEHDVVNTSKAVAYSGMLMLFPLVMVIATLLARGPEGSTVVGEFRALFEQFLPADSMDIFQYSLQTHRTLTLQLVLSGTGLSAFAGLGVMLSLMEGFRRAYRLPLDDSSGPGHPGDYLRTPNRGVDDRQLPPRAARRRAAYLAHGALGAGPGH